MTYNDIYLRWALLNDLGAFELPSKAMTEKLILRAHYGRAVRDFESVKDVIAGDAKADDAAKAEAVKAKAGETAEGFSDRRFSVCAFEQIVAAASSGQTVASALAQPDDGGTAGRLPVETWLQAIADTLVTEE